MQTTNLRRLGPTVKVNDLKCHMLWNSHPMLRSLRSFRASHAIELVGGYSMLHSKLGGVDVCCLIFGWGVVYSTTVLVNWWFGSRFF